MRTITINPRNNELQKETPEQFKERVERRRLAYEECTGDKSAKISLEEGRAVFSRRYLYGVDLDEALISRIIDVDKLSVEQRLRNAAQVTQALREIHCKDYIHCDIKGTNIIFKNPESEPDVNLYPEENARWHEQPPFSFIDFESSATQETYQRNNSLLFTENFTVQVCAPEIISANVLKHPEVSKIKSNSDPSVRKHLELFERLLITTAFDIYSFAFVLIAIMLGLDAICKQTKGDLKIPVPEELKDWSKQKIEKVLAQETIAEDKRYRYAINKKVFQKKLKLFPKPVRKELSSLISGCLATDPKDRPEAKQIQQQLETMLKKLAAEKENVHKGRRATGFFSRFRKSNSSSDLNAAKPKKYSLPTPRQVKTI